MPREPFLTDFFGNLLILLSILSNSVQQPPSLRFFFTFA
jgi:hypothetical protein